MRVIAGTFRSRILKAPAGTTTRPTSDRLRETLFNVVATRISGARVADLYAGSGAVGIEALSRGASHVAFAENQRQALESIRANLQTLGIHSAFTINAAGTADLLGRDATPFDIVFLDPPYDQAQEYIRTLTTLGTNPRLLHQDSLVVAEHARKAELAPMYGRLVRTRTLVQGDAALSFFAVVETEAAPADEP